LQRVIVEAVVLVDVEWVVGDVVEVDEVIVAEDENVDVWVVPVVLLVAEMLLLELPVTEVRVEVKPVPPPQLQQASVAVCPKLATEAIVSWQK